MTNRQTETKITALYERLSKDDDIMGESNSISTQKEMLESYAKQNGFSNIQHYTDDGYSGGNFERPAWKQMIADIDNGKVGAVIVKDMSRVGRDYLQTGFYTEVLFRQQGVRFIAVSNGVDSSDVNSSEFAPFLNIMNEWYLRDCSRKQIAAFQVRGNAGKPTTCDAIYGYKKDPEDKHHWIIDEEAAKVVKRIFNLAIEGNGTYGIAKILMNDKIEKPSVYLARQNRGTQRNVVDFNNEQYTWLGTTVKAIIRHPEYMGHTVNFRSYKEHYKDKKRIMRPPSEWLIFENTHEAIVDKQTWELAQKIIRTPRRTDSNGVANPLTGLVYCADCGAKMYNHKGTAKGEKYNLQINPETGLYPYDFYDCSTHTITRYRENKKCFAHYINTNSLRELILYTIQTVSNYAISNKAEFTEKVRSLAKVSQETTAKELKKKINRDMRRCDELDNIIKKLYESYADGTITKKRFESLSVGYEEEQASLEEAIAQAQTEISVYEEDTKNIDKFMELAKKYIDCTTLTTPMINEFIDKIIVHAPQKINGERVQDVDIYLQFIGKFELPYVEPTPEELAEAEKLRIKRQKNKEAVMKYQKKMRANRKAAQEEQKEQDEKQKKEQTA